MKLDAMKFGMACAITFAVLWIVCSLMCWLFPIFIMELSGYMMHIDASQFVWQLSLTGVFIGLILWSLTAGITGWLVAYIYNRLFR